MIKELLLLLLSFLRVRGCGAAGELDKLLVFFQRLNVKKRGILGSNFTGALAGRGGAKMSAYAQAPPEGYPQHSDPRGPPRRGGPPRRDNDEASPGACALTRLHAHGSRGEQPFSRHQRLSRMVCPAGRVDANRLPASAVCPGAAPAIPAATAATDAEGRAARERSLRKHQLNRV
jgi:hypothetical protein